MPANIDRWPISKKPYFLYNAAFVFAVVLIASLFGILTRPMGLLAAVWPANAVLMAFMIRRQELARAECWLAALLAYLTADLMTGGEVYVTLWLTGANLTGVAVGYHLQTSGRGGSPASQTDVCSQHVLHLRHRRSDNRRHR